MGLNGFSPREPRPLPIFVVADTSRSMWGGLMRALNLSLAEMVTTLGTQSRIRGKFQLCVITCGGEVKVEQSLYDVRRMVLPKLVSGGDSNLGEALEFLSDMLEDTEVVPVRAYTPIVAVLSAAPPADCPEEIAESGSYFDWLPVKALREGERASKCLKKALGVGDCVRQGLLEAITSDVRMVDKADSVGVVEFFREVTRLATDRMEKSLPGEAIGINSFAEIAPYLWQDKRLSFPVWYNMGHGLRERLFKGYCLARDYEDEDSTPLALTLFEMLRAGHPYISDSIMDGTPEDEARALAGRIDYVGDSNATNMLPQDAVLTKRLQDLFERAFSGGYGADMPSAKDYCQALLEASNQVIRCETCGAWHYPWSGGGGNCPWCDHASKPDARLDFYDILTEGTDVTKGLTAEAARRGRHVNAYMIRNGKNRIKNLFTLRSLDHSDFADNYLTVVKDGEKFWIYNEFEKKGLIIRQGSSGKLFRLEEGRSLPLKDGDCVYFEVANGRVKVVAKDGRRYFFLRMARFTKNA